MLIKSDLVIKQKFSFHVIFVVLHVLSKKMISVDNFNIYPNTRLGKLVKANKLEEVLDLCDDFCPGQPPEYFFDRYENNTCAHLLQYCDESQYVKLGAK